MLAFLFSPIGRFGRANWWVIQLIALVILGGMLLTLNRDFLTQNPIAIAPILLVLLAEIWMTICATIKRYHDRGKSAWWFLFQFIPIIGPIWALIELGFCAGDYGDNDYGDGPDMDIEEDLKALRALSGEQPSAAKVPPYRPAPAATSGGPAVFGKRG